MNQPSLSRSVLFLTLLTAPACGGSGDTTAGPGGGGNSSGSGGSATGSGGAGTGGDPMGSGGTASGTGGSGGDGSGGSGGGVGPGPDAFPLLVVATADSVLVWRGADALESSSPASFELALGLGEDGVVTGVVGTSERLGVLTSVGLYLFDDPSTLDGSSEAAALIPESAFSSTIGGGFHHEVVDAAGDLWITYGPGRTALLKDFEGLTSSSTPQAEFTHEWDQLASAAYYEPADLLFAVQVSSAGVLYYEDAKTKSGATAPTGSFDSFQGWGSVALEDSLFVSGTSGLGVWHELDSSLSPRAPDATPSDAGLYVDAAADTVATVTGSGELFVYPAASASTSSSKPWVLDLGGLPYGLDLSEDGTSVAVVGTEEVSLVEVGAAALSLQAQLPLSGLAGQDVLLIE